MNNTEAERQLEREIKALQQQLSDLRITSEMEQEKVLLREFEDRFAAIKLPESEEDTIREIEDDLEKHITERNEVSMKEKGHPEYVFKMLDGERLFKRYADLTPDELAAAKTQGFG
jgi:protein associated with RNAse G/E